MTWHPPIPAKKLYSSDALQLGAGVALLLWCYDGIERDGHVDIALTKLATEFGVSYRTIKEWWSVLRDGPFFRKKEDRGRNGWRVWLADEWIDWHVMANNYPSIQGQNSAPKDSNEGQDNAPKVAQVPLKSRSSPAEGQNGAPETPAYKEDHIDQESTGVKRDSLHGEMFVAIARLCKIDLKLCTAAQRNQVAQTTKALRKAGKTPEEVPKIEAWWYESDWRGKKGEPPRPSQIQEVWQQATEPRNTNGAHSRGTSPQGSRVVRGQSRPLSAERAADYKRQLAELEQPDD
jgi:hypothetical protein